ncbi:MAG: DUF6478 family protein [Alphaproteobacteria bacterium]
MSWLKKKPERAPSLGIDVPEDFEVPAKTQWGFTPTLQTRVTEGGMLGAILTGTNLGPNVTVHHSGEGETFSIQRPDDYSDGLVFDFPDFNADFFSLAIDLPEDGARWIGGQDLLRIALRTSSETPFDAYARLNLCYGPNTEKIVRMIRIGEGDSFAEFDVFYTEFGSGQASSVWIDLIFNSPKSKKITLEQVVVLRRARASL